MLKGNVSVSRNDTEEAVVRATTGGGGAGRVEEEEEERNGRRGCMYQFCRCQITHFRANRKNVEGASKSQAELEEAEDRTGEGGGECTFAVDVKSQCQRDSERHGGGSSKGHGESRGRSTGRGAGGCVEEADGLRKRRRKERG